MRILIVTHCHGNYGASRSLSLLTRHLQGHDITLVAAKSPLRNFHPAELSSFYGIPKERIEELYLPFEYCYMGRPEESLLKLKNYAKNALWIMHKKKLLELISAHDIVYLNSTVLYPLVNLCNKPVISHIREMVIDKVAISKLEKSNGLIFIDKATSMPFKNITGKSIILNNPFDMTGLSGINPERIRDKYGIDGDATVFACVGRINKVKGIRQIIEAFMKSRIRKATLLIVGEGDNGSSYEHECKSIAEGDSRIRFPGEFKNPDEIYSISDCILRGEEKHLIGRTVFEALFAGCNVIMPGSESNLQDNPCLKEFSDKVKFYPPNDVNSLAQAISETERISGERNFRSNVEKYIETFNEFINRIKVESDGNNYSAK